MTESPKKKSAIKSLKKKISEVAGQCTERLDGYAEDLRTFQRKLRKQSKLTNGVLERLDALGASIEAVRSAWLSGHEKLQAENAALLAEIERLKSLIQGPMTVKIRELERRVSQCEDQEREAAAMLSSHSRTLRNYAEVAVDN